MRRRAVPVSRAARAIAMLAMAVAVAACFELSGPADDVASIGVIRAAWPSVVLGDTLRDSTGAVAPLRVAAFDANGDTIRDARPQLALVGEPDRALRIDEDGRVLGLSVRQGTAASDTVIALFFGLQAPKLVLSTVLRPDFVTRPAGDIEEQKLAVSPNDTMSKATSAQLTVHVWHRYATGDSAGVPHWIVSYEIIEQPASTDGQPLAFLAASTVRTTRDTTDAQGAAGRNLLVRAHRMAQVQDTVVVRARAVYRGASLPGTSTLEFRVPIALGVAAP